LKESLCVCKRTKSKNFNTGCSQEEGRGGGPIHCVKWEERFRKKSRRYLWGGRHPDTGVQDTGRKALKIRRGFSKGGGKIGAAGGKDPMTESW